MIDMNRSHRKYISRLIEKFPDIGAEEVTRIYNSNKESFEGRATPRTRIYVPTLTYNRTREKCSEILEKRDLNERRLL